MTAPWLTVVGIGEDGLPGLSDAARSILETARVLIGGERQLALVPGTTERIPWRGLTETLSAVEALRGQPGIVVLASGDPMLFGLGATLARRLDPEELVVLPHVSSFSLAAARLSWPLADCRLLTVHGRPIEGIVPHLVPGERLLVLCADGSTPAAVAALLCRHGYGPSRLTALWHLGGPQEGRRDGTAAAWDATETPSLVVLAVECVTEPGARVLPRTPGLPDDVFRHDGQITKRVVRATTVAALQPLPGRLLWDVGAGSGSIAIEWMRAATDARAVAFESHPGRHALIAANAQALGVPRLTVVHGRAPEILADAGRRPDAVFVGGGVSRPGVLEAAWDALERGGRLVANAVTAEAEPRLLACREAWNGELTRLAVSHLKQTSGGLHMWDAGAPVTQLVAVKP